jgi:hypothetical protein
MAPYILFTKNYPEIGKRDHSNVMQLSTIKMIRR